MSLIDSTNKNRTVRTNSDPVWRRTIRNSVKSAAGHLFNKHNRDLAHRDIFVFSTRRSGSTWLIEIIASQSGIRYIEDPLINRNIHRRYKTLLPNRDYFFTRSPPADESLLHQYFDALLSGSLHVGTSWRFWQPNYNFQTHRNVVKLANAGGLIKWIKQIYSPTIVILLRHPIPTALSQKKWGLQPYTESFRNDEWYFEKVLNTNQRQLINQIIETGSSLERRVADWCLENILLLRHTNTNNALVITYEEMCVDPQAALRALANHCELRQPDRLATQVARLSKTKSKDAAKHGVSPEHWQRWLDQISLQERRRAMDICETFGNNVYTASSPAPQEFLVGQAFK